MDLLFEATAAALH